MVEIYLSLWEIARAWSRVAGEPPNVLSDALIITLCDSAVVGEEPLVISRDDDGAVTVWLRQAVDDAVRSESFRDPAARDAYLKAWRVRRENFARLYARSHLSAGAPLGSFWPAPDGQESDVEAVPRHLQWLLRNRVGMEELLKRVLDMPFGRWRASADSKPSQDAVKPGPENLRSLIEAAAQAVFPPDGERPVGMLKKKARALMSEYIAKLGHKPPDDKTYSRHDY